MTQDSTIELPVGTDYEKGGGEPPAGASSDVPDPPDGDSPFDGSDDVPKPYGVISPMMFEDTDNQRPNCDGGRIITHHRPVAGDPSGYFPPWVGTVVVRYEDKAAGMVGNSPPIQFAINTPTPGPTPESFAECLGLAFDAYDEAAAPVIAANIETIKQQIKQKTNQHIVTAGAMPQPPMQPQGNRQTRRRARSNGRGGVA
jgi:hypothetical protein